MKFNQETFDLSCRCLWIIIPLLLLSLTNLKLWQIIIILVLLAIGLKMFKVERILYEKFVTQCPNCDNPYVIQKFIRIHDQSQIDKEKKKPIPIEIKPIIAIPLTPQQQQELQKAQERQSTSLPPSPQPVQIKQPSEVSVKKVEEKVTVCDALKRSGFNASWTHEDVKKLSQTPDGQKKINQINQDVLKLTKLEKLTNQDIVNCYPKYITDYVCKINDNQQKKIQSDQCTTSDVEQFKKKIQQQQQEIDNLTKLVTGKENTQNNQKQENISDIKLQNQIMNETIKTQVSNGANNIKTNQHCNIENVGTDIRLEVEKFYGSAYEQLKKLQPPLSSKQLDQIKMQYLTLSDIVQSKAILEFKQLIALYQNRTPEQWKSDLILRRTYSIRGHQVPGTDFYIPWSIFDKNSKCFGFAK